MNQYVLSVAAALDLDEIWDFIAQDNIDSADRWINKSSMFSLRLLILRGWDISAKTSQPSQSCSRQSEHT